MMMRESNMRELYQGFVTAIQAGQPADHQKTALACLLLKKFFLDERKSEANLEQLTIDDFN